MNETRLGEFEEVILLLVGILGEDAYALKIADEFEVQTKKSASIGAVHATLSRMADKGFLKSKMGEPTAQRGGRRLPQRPGPNLTLQRKRRNERLH